jgi:saccharopine dehydrogenase-like NADP-dependent oxidoreductase
VSRDARPAFPARGAPDNLGSMKKTIVVLGAGKIGRMVTHLLARCGDYTVRVGDRDQQAAERVGQHLPDVRAQEVDFTNAGELDRFLRGGDAVISCAPFQCNPLIAERARATDLHYLDLTEDVEVSRRAAEVARGARTAFIPQCGLAPGFITIVAVHLMAEMTDVTDLRLRVGALPRFPHNRLKYNLTWSTNGLINEYCNPCEVVHDGEMRTAQPLENLEELTIDGVRYEAFNTSGGLGTLARTLAGRVRNVNYKSIRYPGHHELIQFLLHDLRMADHRDELERIFDRALPTTFQDQIVIFVSATGTFRGRLTDNVFTRTIYHDEIDGENWSAIQITTASGVCAVLDLLMAGKIPTSGFVKQEQVPYTEFITNRFGRSYA